MLNTNTPLESSYTDELLIFQDKITGEYSGIEFSNAFRKMMSNAFPGEAFTQMSTIPNPTPDAITNPSNVVFRLQDNLSKDALGNPIYNYINLEALQVITGIVAFEVDTSDDTLTIRYQDEYSAINESKIPLVDIRAALPYATTAETLAGTVVDKVISPKTLKDVIDAIPAPVPTVINDTLSSTSITEALSAKQGKILNDKDIAAAALVGTNFEFTRNDGTKITLDATAVLADVRVTSGAYNSTTNALDFTLSDSSTISVPVAALLPVTHDTTLTGDGATTPLSISLSTDASNAIILGTDGKIYAPAAKISTTPNNRLVSDANGLFVSNEIAEFSAANGIVQITDEDGSINVVSHMPDLDLQTTLSDNDKGYFYSTVDDKNTGVTVADLKTALTPPLKTINTQSISGTGNIAVEPVVTAGAATQYYAGDKTWKTLDKTVVGLANVDNTSDLLKPISTAQATINALKQDKTSVATHTLILGTATTSQKIRLNDQTLNSDLDVDTLFSVAPAKDANGKIILSPAGNVRYGTTAPAVLGTDKINDTYVRTSDGTANGSLISSYVFSGTQWTLQYGGEEIINVTGVTLPIAFPVTTLPGTPVFLPNTPAVTGVLYELTDGTQIQFTKWNGTQYISAPAPTPAPDFFRSATGTTLPNGVTDDTENVSRSGKTGFGILNPTTVTAYIETDKNFSTIPFSIANAPVDFTNSGTIFKTMDIPHVTVDLYSHIELTGVTVDTWVNVGVTSTMTVAQLTALKGRYLRLANNDKSTHKSIYKGFEILPGKFLDLIHNGRMWVNEVEFVENYEGYEFIGIDVVIPTFTSGATTYVDVPTASFIAPIAGDYEVKYTILANNGSVIFPTKMGNDVKFVTDNTSGTFVTIDGSVTEIGNTTGLPGDNYTRYFRVRTTRPNQVVKMQLNSIIGNTAITSGTISYKRYTSLASAPSSLPPRFGTTAPSVLPTDKAGQFYFRNKDGASVLEPYQEYIFTGTAWYRTDGEDNFLTHPNDQAPLGVVPAGATSYLDFNGGYSGTITLPSAAARKNEIFSVIHTAGLDSTILGTNKYPATPYVLNGTRNSARFISDGTNWIQLTDLPLNLDYAPSTPNTTAPAGAIPAGATSYKDANADWSSTVTLPTAIGRRDEVFTYHHTAGTDATVAATNKLPATPLLVNSTMPSVQFISDGANWVQLTSPTLTLKKFRIVQNLVAGANVITDNLGLLTPFARSVDIRLDLTGETLSCRITAETANTFTITSTAAVTNARITSIG